MKGNLFFLPIAIMLALIGRAAASPVVEPLVSIGEAEHLVMAELIHEHRNKLPGLSISSEPRQDPDMPSFWVISVDWDGIDDVGTGTEAIAQAARNERARLQKTSP